jgi:periplasmic divalent cation tolerance protein
VALSTAGSEEEGARIARALIDQRLAACVNLVPQLRSIYRWKGSVCDENEWLLVIKTQRRLLTRLSRALQELHSYEVPELIAWPIQRGSRAYLAWLHDCLK